MCWRGTICCLDQLPVTIPEAVVEEAEAPVTAAEEVNPICCVTLLDSSVV